MKFEYLRPTHRPVVAALPEKRRRRPKGGESDLNNRQSEDISHPLHSGTTRPYAQSWSCAAVGRAGVGHART